MKIQGSVLFLLLFLITYGISQEIAQVPVLKRPTSLNLPKANEVKSLSFLSDIPTEGNLWVAYSDRSNNQTKSTPGGTTTVKTLDFLEKLYVIGIDGEYLHIVKDENLSISGNTSQEVEDCGWIHSDNLLLWEKCLVTDTGRVDKKAMVLNTLKSAKNSIDLAEKDISIIKFSSSPDLRTPNGKESNLFQLFFIYKYDGNSALLGTDALFTNANDLQRNLWGWAPVDMLVFWDHRVALEPNWEIDAVNERKSKNRPAKFFSSENQAVKYKNNVNISEAFWDADPYNNRNIGDWRRFPLLEIDNNGIVHSGVMGRVYASSEYSKSSEEVAQLLKVYRELVQNIRKVNVVFVMDATTSMQPYYSSIGDAIKNSVIELRDKYSNKNDLRFGFVAYRDYSEGSARLIEYEELTASPDKIISKIENVQAGDIKDLDSPEAMYYGLYFALEQLLPQNESNIIILVGDAGNHQSDNQVDVNEIIDLFADKNCSLMAFQVHHERHGTYQDFIDQNKEILLKAGEIQYNKYSKVASKLNEGLDRPQLKLRSGTTYELSNSAFIGSITECPLNNVLSPQDLNSKVEKTIVETNLYYDNLVQYLKEMIDAGLSKKTLEESHDSIFTSNYEHAVTSLLVNSGYTRDEIDFMVEKNYQLHINGYSPYTIEGFKYPLYKRVLLLNMVEFADLINSIQSLLTGSSQEDLRQRMKEAWIKLLKKYIGDFSEEEFNAMPMNDIYEKVFGIPLEETSILINLKLQDITNRSKLSEKEFYEYYSQIKSKLSELKKILNSRDYPYLFRSNEKPYYWLSVDLLP